MANGNGLPGLYHKIPTNIRLFMEQIFGADSTITEQDFTDEELAVMRDRIIDQEARNVEEEEKYRTMYEELTHPDYVAAWENDPAGWRPMVYIPGVGTEYVSDDTLEAERQQKLDRLRIGIESYDTTRDKLSVPYPGKRKTPPPALFPPEFIESFSSPETEELRRRGLHSRGGWIDTLIESFSSPETNVTTTLGQFNVVKNDDGTVTIKDTYSWNPVPPDVKLSLKDFFTLTWKYRNNPEALGNVFMRLVLPERERDVEIDLPMRGED